MKWVSQSGVGMSGSFVWFLLCVFFLNYECQLTQYLQKGGILENWCYLHAKHWDSCIVTHSWPFLNQLSTPSWAPLQHQQPDLLRTRPPEFSGSLNTATVTEHEIPPAATKPAPLTATPYPSRYQTQAWRGAKVFFPVPRVFHPVPRTNTFTQCIFSQLYRQLKSITTMNAKI